MSGFKKNNRIHSNTHTALKKEDENKMIMNEDIITNLKFETCSEAEESGTEDNNEVKCEYLEYEDETSNGSDTNTHIIDFIQEDTTVIEKSEFPILEKVNEIGKHEDLFLIIVSNTEKESKKKCSRSKVDKNKSMRKCDLCNKWYSTNYFSDHMRRLHGDKELKEKAAEISAIKRKLKSTKVNCQICQKIVSKVNYKAHFATHDPNKLKYVCDVCGKTFAQQRLLVVHKVTHNTEYNFECKLCPYKGRSSDVLRLHMLKHKGDYRYVCQECPAKFLTKSNLNKHSQIHIKEPRFTCEMCQQGFKLIHQLNRHIKVDHLSIRKFVCDICGKAFEYKKGVVQHQVNVHQKKKKLHS